MNTHQPLHGRLEDVHFSELLLTISQRKESGVLHVARQKIEKDVYFQDGRIIFAKSNDPDERLGELCLRTGKISFRHLDESAKKVVPGLRLGTILVQEGFLRASDLYQGVIHQVEEIVYSLFDWSDGTFEFRAGELPTKEVITLSISTPDIIIAGINRVWRWSWIRDWVGPLDTVYVRKEDWEIVAKRMTITPVIQAIMDLLEKPRSLEEILNTSSLTNFETCKILWALLIIGIIQPAMPRTATLQLPFEPEVTSDIFAMDTVKEEAASLSIDDTPPLARRYTDLPQPIPEPPKMIVQEPVSQIEAEVRVEPAAEETIAEQTVFENETELSVTEANPSGTNEIPIPILPPDHKPEESMGPVFMMESDLEITPVEISFSDLAEASRLSSIPQIEPDALKTPVPPTSLISWEQNIPTDVNNFNEVHRFIFEMLRMELGASVVNFLQRILNKASAQHPLVFDGVKMNEFGELDRSALESNIQGNLADRYPDAFAFLLKEEQEMMQTYLDRKRAESIKSALNRILEKQKLPS
jgi:hypothetical protein